MEALPVEIDRGLLSPWSDWAREHSSPIPGLSLQAQIHSKVSSREWNSTARERPPRCNQSINQTASLCFQVRNEAFRRSPGEILLPYVGGARFASCLKAKSRSSRLDVSSLGINGSRSAACRLVTDLQIWHGDIGLAEQTRWNVECWTHVVTALVHPAVPG
ncbi:uncharacterized protein TrAtP1_012526 [Trichoderma atroviride]|uniref:uncharacterized protein n=1 Tax=Hypocrea atroviridis TaxID=63577 RepID=UPI0033223E98|nr:hypothetical protein TrAtP1_012526 [Trichoderma atroviride]